MTSTVYTITLIIWFAVLLAALVVMIIANDNHKRNLNALEDLVASSPAVCYSCLNYGVYEPLPTGLGDRMIHLRGLQDHEFIEARLVYIPDELLR